MSMSNGGVLDVESPGLPRDDVIEVHREDYLFSERVDGSNGADVVYKENHGNEERIVLSINEKQNLLGRSSPDISEVNNKKKSEEDVRLSTWELVKVLIGFGFVAFGLSIAFAVEIIFSTPFIESCGVSRTLTSFYWILGPSMVMTGIPLLGFFSDRLYIPLMGRRRPWIIIGSILISITMAVFSNSKAIGNLIYPNDPINANYMSQLFVSISFFFLDASLNIGYVFMKSLICDVVPQSQQLFVNTVVGGFFMGIGSIVGFLLGSIPWSQFVPFCTEDIQTLYFINIVILLLATGVTCLMIHETKILKFQSSKSDDYITKTSNVIISKIEDEITNSDDGEELSISRNEYELMDTDDEKDEMEEEYRTTSFVQSNEPIIIPNNLQKEEEEEEEEEDINTTKIEYFCCYSVSKKICSVFLFLFKLPVNFWLCFLVQSMSYVTKYVVYLYISDFVATQIFQGSPTAPEGSSSKKKFDDGVRWSNYGGAIMAIAGIMYALILPLLLKFISARLLWMFAQFLLGGCVIAGWIFAQSESVGKYLIFFSFFFFGICQTSMNTIPWAIVNVISRDNEYLRNKRGLIQTIFYGTIMFPEIIVSLVGGPMMALIRLMGIPELKGLFLIAGIIGWVSILFILLIRFPPSMGERNKMGVYCSCQVMWCGFKSVLSSTKKSGKGYI